MPAHLPRIAVIYVGALHTCTTQNCLPIFRPVIGGDKGIEACAIRLPIHESCVVFALECKFGVCGVLGCHVKCVLYGRLSV